MTLIEVVAGLVILGTILASLAIARGRFARQLAAADRTLAATRALDSLITEWMASSPPVNRHGNLAGPRGLEWQTRTLQSREAEQLSAAVLRVEVIDRLNEHQSQTPMLTVDLLLHVSPRRMASQPETPGGRAP
jgi:hypothetical protein